MARMYPEHPRYCQFKSDTERLLYDELKRQLPETYTVMYSVSLQLRRDERSEINAEIDFRIVLGDLPAAPQDEFPPPLGPATSTEDDDGGPFTTSPDRPK